ncbi:MAG: hypothetical protein Q8941_08380 [Bacteroidota bacterium]|nr:hypothetical protein [Bacteroidota bacterium]
MFTQTWKKYLPVIAILLKRSVNGEQTLKMNHTDFERAAAGRKIKFSFSNLQLNNGRLNTMAKHTPIVKEFAQLLQEHELTRGLLRNQDLEFMMTNDFQLLIRNNTAKVKDVQPQETTES